MATNIGFFGKLPSHGDFLERDVSGAFRDVWDEWLQRCIDASRRSLGEMWLETFLTSPIWRFYLSEGVAGASSFGGILLPSMDRVGRYFPLSIVLELPPALSALSFANAAADWFEDVETLCASAVENPDLDFRAFEEALMASTARLDGLEQWVSPVTFPGRTAQWRWPLHSTREPGVVLADPLLAAAQTSFRPLTMWWTEGSEQVETSVLLIRGLPRPESFEALLTGGWDESHWDGILDPSEPSGPRDWRAPGATSGSMLAAEVSLQSAGVTDAGVVRDMNQDNFMLNDAYGLWAVSDGMGGHAHGEVASQMVVDALHSLPPAATLNTALEAVSTALSRVNADLRRGVSEEERCGATVVALLIRDAHWAISWAGDSRGYLHRDGTLTQLTQDHSVAAELAAQLGVEVAAPTGEITRAIGGEDALELERVSDLVFEGDRFLLCSDGLYGTLNESEIATHLRSATAQEASRALIDAACLAGAQDNVTAVVVVIMPGGAATRSVEASS